MQRFVPFKQQLSSFSTSCHTSGMREYTLPTHCQHMRSVKMLFKSKHCDKENTKALVCVNAVLEVCMQDREEVFGEEASRAGIGKAVGNSVLVKEQYWERCFSALAGCPPSSQNHTACTGGSSTKPCTTLTWMRILHILWIFYLFEEWQISYKGKGAYVNVIKPLYSSDM